MAIDIGGHLDRRVAHLFGDIFERSPGLDKQQAKGMSKIVQPETAQAGMLQHGQEKAMVKIIGI